jgi:hypothetical protein
MYLKNNACAKILIPQHFPKFFKTPYLPNFNNIFLIYKVVLLTATDGGAFESPHGSSRDMLFTAKL